GPRTPPDAVRQLVSNYYRRVAPPVSHPHGRARPPSPHGRAPAPSARGGSAWAPSRPVGRDGPVRDDTVTDAFEEHRPVLLGVAYRMLGRVADAEDVVQDAWLRWAHGDRSEVREPRAFLVRVTTRLAIDRLRQIKARGETYVGP